MTPTPQPADVRLRAPEPADIDAMYRLESQTDVASISWGRAPVSRQMIWEYVNAYSADIYRDGQLRLVIDCDGRFCGTIDISDFDPANGRAMVGIALEAGCRGLGIASRALEMCIEYCRSDIGMHQLAAIVPIGNAPSMRLFERANFKTSGRLRSWVRRGRTYEDAIVMQLLF